MTNNSIIKSILTSGAVFFAPAAYFILKNIQVYDFGFLAISFIATGAALAFSLVLISPVFLIGKRDLFARLFFTASLLWYFQFYLSDAKEFLPGISRNLFLVSIAVFASTLGLYSHVRAVQRFVVLFLALNCALIIFPVLINTAKDTVIESRNAEVGPLLATSSFNENNTRGVNVYYVIVDGMNSKKTLNQIFDIDVTADLKYLSQLGYFNVSHAKSSYNLTTLTLASIFHQSYFLDESSLPYKDRSRLYPAVLFSPSKLSLLRNVDALGYRFIHISNSWSPCASLGTIRCLSDIPGYATSFVSELANNYALNTFLSHSLLLKRIQKLSRRDHAKSKKSINDNDAIRTAVEFIQHHPDELASRKNFVFIHHMNPHPPFRKESCELLENVTYTEWIAKDYKSSVICTLTRIRQLSDLIAKVDPTAIVVFQADHGSATIYDFDANFESLREEQLMERFSIFNAIKLPDDCKSGLTDSLGNVDTINLVLSCLGLSILPRPETKSFAGFYEKNLNFGHIRQVTFK